MKKKLFIVALMLAASAAGYFFGQQLARDDAEQTTLSKINAADVSTRKVEFSLPDLEGDIRQSSEWDGTARIINFWATWCAPCRREIPLLKETQAKHGDDGLQILGIAVDFTDDVIAYAEEALFNYPILVGQEAAMAVAESSGVEFIGLPFTMIVSPEGDLLGVHMGEIHAPQIETIVAELQSLRRGDTDIDSAREALKAL